MRSAAAQIIPRRERGQRTVPDYWAANAEVLNALLAAKIKAYNTWCNDRSDELNHGFSKAASKLFLQAQRRFEVEFHREANARLQYVLQGDQKGTWY